MKIRALFGLLFGLSILYVITAFGAYDLHFYQHMGEWEPIERVAYIGVALFFAGCGMALFVE